MKNLLFFIGLICLCSNSYSQQTKVARIASKTKSDVRFSDDNIAGFSNSIKHNVSLKNGNEELLERIEIGTSGNGYSFLASCQRGLAYDEASGMLLATHRANPAADPEALSSGTIVSHYSSDGGLTWTSQITMNPDPDNHSLRYPSGVIYNPEANTNPEDLYTVICGPSHVGGVWDYTYFGSSTLIGSNFNDYYHPWSEVDGNDWARSSMTVTPFGVYNFGQDYENTAGDLGINQTMKQYVGTTDNPIDGFDWEVNTVTPDWLTDPVDGNSIALYTTWSAWSKDGSIGYMWLIGATTDSEEYGGYQPQVFYTEDSGDSWEEIELDIQDHPTLIEYLPAWEDVNGNPGTVKPTMGIAQGGNRDFPGVVDYNGDLHLFGQTYGSSTESVVDPSSGYWTVGNNLGGHIFDFIINPEGIQDVIFVDSVMTKVAPENFYGELSWGHRLQASKSLDEKVVFAVWSDDRASDDGTLKNPDLYAWGYNVETNVYTESVNFTEDDLYAGFYLYHFVSEYTPKIDGFFNIPITTSVLPGEFGTNDPTLPVTHTYVKGIGFEEEVFIGINNIEIDNHGFLVLQNYPNPVDDHTIFEIYSNSESNAILEICDQTGRIVNNRNLILNEYKTKISVNVSNLKQGVYFYTVICGDMKQTKKMIIK